MSERRELLVLLGSGEASCYAPWADEWTAPSAAPASGIVPLPAFTRSVVVKVTHAQAAAS